MKNRTPVVASYEVAKNFAISCKFQTIKQYSDYVRKYNIAGMLDNPTLYPEYTTAYEFLGKTLEEYRKEKFAVAVSNRDQKTINAKVRNTWAKKREAKALVTTTPIVATPTNTFTPEQVVDFLIESNASTDYIAGFIETHSVEPKYAMTVLLGLLKQKTEQTVEVWPDQPSLRGGLFFAKKFDK